MLDLLIKNILITNSTKQFLGDIAILNGSIIDTTIAKYSTAKEVIDGKNLIALPGMIDTQVHFREPGLTHKEDLETGPRAAVVGGVTTFLEMPNTNPSTTDLDSIEVKIKIAKKKSLANFAFFIGATGNNTDELSRVNELRPDGLCGIKIFLGSSTGNLLLFDDELILNVMNNTSMPIAFHSENEEMLVSRKDIQQNAKSVHDHYKWRNVETAMSSTRNLIKLAKSANRKIHVLHISSKEEIEFLKENKDICTIEATPQHLRLFAPDCYDKFGTLVQMNPPIRTKEHKDALVKALVDKTIDVIGSDHAPHQLDEKNKGYPLSPSGIPGVQTIFPLTLKFCNEGIISIYDLVRLLAEMPASIYNMKNKGKIKIGFDADILIMDMNKEFTIKNKNQESKSSYSPFDNEKIKGTIKMTIVNGNIIVKNGVIINNTKGRPVKFK